MCLSEGHRNAKMGARPPTSQSEWGPCPIALKCFCSTLKHEAAAPRLRELMSQVLKCQHRHDAPAKELNWEFRLWPPTAGDVRANTSISAVSLKNPLLRLHTSLEMQMDISSMQTPDGTTKRRFSAVTYADAATNPPTTWKGVSATMMNTCGKALRAFRFCPAEITRLFVPAASGRRSLSSSINKKTVGELDGVLLRWASRKWLRC